MNQTGKRKLPPGTSIAFVLGKIRPFMETVKDEC